MQVEVVLMRNNSPFYRLYLLLISYLIILFSSISAFADFGKSCSSPSNEIFAKDITSNEFSNPTIISYVKSLIDIKNNVSDKYMDGCNDKLNDRMIIRVRNIINGDTYANDTNSNKFEILNGQTVLLGDLAEGLDIIKDDINLANIELRVGRISDKICIAIPSVHGYFPILCKDYPASSTKDITEIFDDMSNCSEYSDGCNLYSKDNPSRSPNSFFGSAMQCVYESLDLIFFDMRTCDQSNIYDSSGDLDEKKFERETKVKPFADFYSSLQLTVSAAITLYVIFFGFKVALNPEELNINDMFLAVAKILLVIYFSVGSTGVNWFTGKSSNNNGVTQLLLPFMLSFSETMSSYVFNNTGNTNLCYFDKDDYEPGYSYYSIWDSFDCRLNVITGSNKIFRSEEYINSKLMPKIIPPGTVKFPYSESRNLPDALKSFTASFVSEFTNLINSIAPGTIKNFTSEGIDNAIYQATIASNALPIMYVITSMILAGGLIHSLLLVVVIIMIAGLSISIFMSYIVCIMILYILAYIAPIFVPMYLFERTKGYFNGWLNLVLSTTLQPVIILGFGAYVLTLMDSFLFEGCKFAKYEHRSDKKYIEFVVRDPVNQDDKDNCENSLGYKLLKMFQYPAGWKDFSLLLFKITQLHDVYGTESSMWTCLIMLLFLRFLLNRVYQLSASLTGGLNIQSAVMEPMMFFSAMNNVKNRAQQLSKEKQNSDRAKGQISNDSVSGK